MENKTNPFFERYSTAFGSVPFELIDNSHYEDAIIRGMALHMDEINTITENDESPTFENTIVAYERSGKDLERVLDTFYPLLSANADDELMDISIRMSSAISRHFTDISLNERLWHRIKTVHDNIDESKLDAEDRMLLTRIYDSFVRKGALLEGDDRKEYKQLVEKLSDLTTRFGQNVLKELNNCGIWLSAHEIGGLPSHIVEAASASAKEKGRPFDFYFTLEQPVYVAVMKFSPLAEVRERFYRLYNSRNTSGEYDNTGIITEIADTRRRIAGLMGREDYASYSLEKTMAEKPENVYGLLDSLAEKYRPAQLHEFEEIEKFAGEMEGHPVKLQAWDYSYYANKLKESRFSYDEETLRPYFMLDNVISGVFGLATRLYGISFVPAPGVSVYHQDVKVYEVKDSDGSHLGLLYTDFFPRKGKRPGAWMTGFREECRNDDGSREAPHVSLVMNFTKPTATRPSLLTPDEVRTFLHEFGHALHGLFADTKYATLSGTNVYRDFVELPSQFNENYLTEKAFLDSFARHYQTRETIPSEYIDMIVSTSQFGAGYACMRQLGFGYVDMAWHTIKAPVDDFAAFERESISKVKIFPDVEGCFFSPQFGHIFSGGYAAGYYSYKWAEVLDADAFSLFKKNGLFDAATAGSFRKNILSKGGTEHPAVLYRRFRGKDATIDALLERDGINN